MLTESYVARNCVHLTARCQRCQHARNWFLWASTVRDLARGRDALPWRLEKGDAYLCYPCHDCINHVRLVVPAALLQNWVFQIDVWDAIGARR